MKSPSTLLLDYANLASNLESGPRGEPLTTKEAVMPNSDGLRFFVRKMVLDHEGWLKLLEARRQLIKPHLDKIPLTKLSKLPCLKREYVLCDMAYSSLQNTGDPRFSLETHGIFELALHEDNARWAWGLTRDGLWVLFKVSFTRESGYKDRGADLATAIEINEIPLADLLARTGTHPETVWRRLGKVICDWTEHRRQLYHQARSVSAIVVAEEAALNISREQD